MTGCAVESCKNYSTKKDKSSNITFHIFPTVPEVANRWTKIIRRTRNDFSWKPKPRTHICSAHFDVEDTYMTESGRRKIRSGAVPTKALYISSTMSDDDENENADNVSTNARRKDLGGQNSAGTASGSSTTPRQKVTKSNRGVPLPEAKEIIASVYHYLQTEYENLKSYTGGSCDLSPLANILKRTAEATGVSEQTVTAVIEEEHSEDPVRSKRAKVSLAFEDEDVSPIEEESSCGSADDAQHDDGERQMEQEEHEVETLKVEVEDYDDDHNDAMKQRLFLEIQPLSTQNVSAVHQSLPVTHAEVKQEPVDAEDQEPMEGGDTVESTASVEDPLCESTSAVHHLLCSTDLEAKSKSKDDVYQDVESSSEFTTHVRRRPD